MLKVPVRGCTVGFPTVQQITSAVASTNCNNPSGVQHIGNSQFLVPHMKFTCSGVVTSLTIGAETPPNNGHTPLVLLIWRPVNTTTYRLNSSLQLGFQFLDFMTCNVYGKMLNETDQLAVEDGDILGVYQDRFNSNPRSSYELYFQSSTTEIYQYAKMSSSVLDEFITPSGSGIMMEPLVTVGKLIK